MKHKKTTLPNGLRIITIPMKSPATTVLVMVETGSNYETKEQNGLSHFLEHMCFKGTKRRPTSAHIAKELDSLGAANNAFTNQEYTGYYAKGSNRHAKKLLEIVSDLYLNPRIPEAELEKERGVILQEISMYEDLPQVQVWDVFMKLLHGDTPAGRPILGPASNIRRFRRVDFINYRQAHYVAKGTMVVVAGDVKPSEIEKEARKLFKDISEAKKHKKQKVTGRQARPAMLIRKKKTDQMHMVLGFRAYPANDKRMPTLEVLSSILGKGMSSRLFQKMREELGACYYVRTNIDDNTDHGFFAISTGIDSSRSEEILKVLLEECRKLMGEKVSESELAKAKEYLVGHMNMHLETSDAVANFYAIQEVVNHKLKNPEDWKKSIKAVTAADVQKVARDIFRNDKLNLAILGNAQNGAKLKKLLRL